MDFTRSYDSQNRVAVETTPAVFPAIQNDTVYTYGYDGKSRLVDVKQFDNTLCVDRVYTFDSVGNRINKDITYNSADGLVCGAESPMDPAIHQVLTYNDYSQLTTAGYVYDVFGRVTSLPSIDTANQAGNVTFAYSPEDRILSQKQGITQTDYNYDALGRRFQDKVGSVVKTVRHYSDESDNPYWVSGTGTAAAQIDIYTPALASSLNATRKVNGTTTTAYLNFGNLHGDTITSLELPTTGYVSGPNELNVYDEYGMPQKPELDNRPVGVSDHTDTTQLFVLNYGSLGQPQRETTDTGIQFMGARGYNPITGQFLTPDPIQGGNETTYNYPNDPINLSDLSGLVGLLTTIAVDLAVSYAADVAGVLLCSAAIIFCGIGAAIALTVVASLAIEAVNQQLESVKKSRKGPNYNKSIQNGFVGLGVTEVATKGVESTKSFKSNYSRSSRKKISRNVKWGSIGLFSLGSALSNVSDTYNDARKSGRNVDLFSTWVF